MPSSPQDYVAYIAQDVLSAIGEIKTRRMFGGHGFYFNGRIFGIEANDKIYFKVTATNQKDYEDAGSEPFHYSAKDKKAVSMSYWEVPEDVLEQREKAVSWALKAIQASQEKKTSKKL
jgi:DNA transformation protein